MISFIAKWKVWYARRQLAAALYREEELRMEAAYIRVEVLPKLEDALEAAEIDLHLTNYLGDRK